MYLKHPKVKQRIRRKMETFIEENFPVSLVEAAHAKGNLRICGLKEMIIAGSVVLASLI